MTVPKKVVFFTCFTFSRDILRTEPRTRAGTRARTRARTYNRNNR